MADNFLKYWFGGFDKFIQSIGLNDRERLFEECGKSC